MEFRTSHLAICVTDLKRSIRFYQALGFVGVESFELPALGTSPINTLLDLQRVHLTAQFMRRPDGATIELLQFQSPGLILGSKPNPMNSPGFTHLSYYVDDLDAAMDWLEANGGKALRHVEAFFNTPGMRAAFCTDPDGVRIELMQLTAQ